MSADATPVEPGQVWESRDGSRQVHIVSREALPPEYPTRWLVSGQRNRTMWESTLRSNYRRVGP